MVSLSILIQFANSFDFHVHTLVFQSNSTNDVYRFTKGNRSYYLRITQKTLVYEEKIKAELDWIQYLVKNGVRAALPIQTSKNQFTAVCQEDNTWYIATAFEAAAGRFFDKDSDQYWNPRIFRNWGETMGMMHRLSKTYESLEVIGSRDSWSMSGNNNPNLQVGRYKVLRDKWISMERQIDILPRDKESFGLIHNDFHPYNFVIQNDKITVFDFDDSIFGWFSLDIAIAATHAIWWGVKKEDRCAKNEFAHLFLYEFLMGYRKENDLAERWIKTIPMFMQYRNICSFFWWLGDWDGDESRLTEEQLNAIDNAVKLIERDVPFDGCDIKI